MLCCPQPSRACIDALGFGNGVGAAWLVCILLQEAFKELRQKFNGLSEAMSCQLKNWFRVCKMH